MNGELGKITFLNPANPTQVVIADKPADFNTHAGGIRLEQV